jgi:hypothetical protein
MADVRKSDSEHNTTIQQTAVGHEVTQPVYRYQQDDLRSCSVKFTDSPLAASIGSQNCTATGNVKFS